MQDISLQKQTSFPFCGINRALLYCLLIFTPLARGSVHYWHHTVIQLFAVTMLAVLIIEKIVTGKPTLYKTGLESSIYGISGLIVISLIFGQSLPDSIEAIGLFVTYVIIFYLVVYSIRTREHQREFVYVLCGIALFLTIVAIFRSIGVTLSIWNYEHISATHLFLTGSYGNHNHLAGYLEMVLPLLLILFVTRSRSGWPLLLLVVVTALVLLGHILAMSRGGWFALVGSLSFLTVMLLLHKRFRKKKMVILLFSGGFFLIVLFLSGGDLFERALSLGDEETLLGMNGRMRVWQACVTMIGDNLFLGSGPGTFATIFPQYQLSTGGNTRFFQAHNDYLQYIAELGILFIPILLWFLLNLFAKTLRKLGDTSRQTWGVALGATTGIVALLIHSFIDFNLHIPANAVLCCVLLALIFGGPRNVEKR